MNNKLIFMLPTPSTSHVDHNRVYEPSEDSYLFLDTLSSAPESLFLNQRFHRGLPTNQAAGPPLILEVGSGSGVVLALVTAHARTIFGRADVLTIGSDINPFACDATQKTIRQACKEVDQNLPSDSRIDSCGSLMAVLHADLASSFRSGAIDVLIFNPPYVPSAQVPAQNALDESTALNDARRSEQDSRLLSLSYEGGQNGMEVINRLLHQLPTVLHRVRGVAYILLCQQNNPAQVLNYVRGWGRFWSAEIVGYSGKQAGWEKLQIIRICRISECD